MPELLAIDRLTAGYGEAVVLNAVSLALAERQSLALLGRNGMGKTTLINSIVGVTRFISGRIAIDGRDITALRPDQRAHAGIGWVPQERNIFKSLTVEENLTSVARPGAWTAERIYELFPRLAERRRNLGNQLSGGEQQMLAVGRALVLNPRVILLDEPLEGLAPILVEELLAALGEPREQLVDALGRPRAGLGDRGEVLLDRERLEDVALLRDPADTGMRPLLRTHAGDIAPIEADAAAAIARNADDRVHQRCLSHAIAAEHGEGLSFCKAEGDAAQHHGLAIARRQLFDLDQFRHRRPRQDRPP